MRSYFHDYPTCPSCHTPHEFSHIKKVDPNDLCENCAKTKGFCHTNDCDVYLMKNDNRYDSHPIYKCGNCEAYFKSNIDFSKYSNILSVFQNHAKSTNNSIPLYWNINLNEIEQSYLEWLNFKDGAIYWITWPWDEVKFMPIFIAEYTFKFPNKKVVVVSNHHEKNAENEFYKPNLFETFKYLYYLPSNENFFNEFKKEMRKFDSIKDIIRKSKKVHFHLKPLKRNLTPYDFTKDYSVYDFKLTHAQVCSIINKKFGNKFVKSVKLEDSMKNCRNVKYEYFDVSIDENLDWGVSRVLFDKLGYFNILYNYNSVQKLSNCLKYTVVSSENFNLNKQIFFIDSGNEKLFDYIYKINPDTIIFSDSDKFFSDYMSKYLFKRQRGQKFINLLKNNEFSTILFSTDKSIRFLINQLEENGLFNSTELYKHTWDSSEVLENIDKNISHNFIFSNSFNNLQNRGEPNVECSPVPSMEIIEKHIDEILKKIKFDKNLYYPFFRTLKTTPLPVLEQDEYNTFIYNRNYSLKSVMDKLCEIINEGKDEDDFYDELMEPFYQIYKNDTIENYNPLCCKIVDVINQYEDEDCEIKIISYTLQKKKLINLLNLEQYDGKVEVLSWNELNKINEDNKKLIVISTIVPNMDYDIYDEKIDKYIFIGGPNYLEYVENIINKRILEKESRPLEIIDDNAPNLLIETLSKVPDNSSEIKEIIKEITIDFKSDIDYENNHSRNNISDYIESSSNILKKDSNAILFVDENGNGIFFPINHVINYMQDGKFLEYDLYNQSLKGLVGKQLFLSSNYYSSNKEVFVKFMVEHGDNLIFKLNDEISFNGFYKFLEANYQWLNNFKELLLLLDKRPRISKPKLILANIIRKAIGADFDYIENVWLSDPMFISTSKGDIGIYPIDRTIKVDNLIKAYDELRKYFYGTCESSEEKEALNQLKLSEYDAIINFNCSVNYQNYRRDFLDGNIKDGIYENFNNELNDILKSSDLFKISKLPKEVKLKEDVNPFKIILDYERYIK